MLDAVVVNYRTPDDLEGFLASWEAFAPDWCNLTIVNVDPRISDRELAKSCVQKHVEQVGRDGGEVLMNGVALPRLEGASISYWRYMEHNSNVGYSYACNMAAAESTADVLAFFNADTRLLSGTIEPLYFNLMTHDDWGVIGPRQVDDNGLLTHAGILGTNENPLMRGWMKKDSSAFCDVRDDAVSVMGSAYFVKRECWEELRSCPLYRAVHPEAAGAFLPTPHYYEETFCSYHATAHNWKVVYYGLSKMIHRWHKASPVGGHADAQFKISQKIFREACDAHGIPRD